MGYCKRKEEEKMKADFRKYAKTLSKGGASPKDIDFLWTLYWSDFNTDRRFRQRQFSNMESTLENEEYLDLPNYPNIDELDNESMYLYLKRDIDQMYSILIGIYHGLSVNEIAFMLGVCPGTIYYRIKKFIKIFDIDLKK